MAGSTLLAVDVGADLQVGWAGLDRGRLHQFAVDARVQRKVDDGLLEGKRRVVGGDWRAAGPEIDPDAKWYDQQAEQQAKRNFMRFALIFRAAEFDGLRAVGKKSFTDLPGEGYSNGRNALILTRTSNRIFIANGGRQWRLSGSCIIASVLDAKCIRFFF